MDVRAVLRTIFTLVRGMARGLPAASADRDPIELFGDLFAAARKCGILLPEAMTLATVGADGRPAARMVLLKGFDQNGFVFFTNYESRKARELEANPHAALVIHWAVLQRQVSVQGRVQRTSQEESETYFRTRPRGSQIGAWASLQSEPLANRQVLVERVRGIEQRFAGADVPLPPFWGGYRLVPERIEFWQGRADRLHDRLCFVRTEAGWTATRLYP